MFMRINRGAVSICFEFSQRGRGNVLACRQSRGWSFLLLRTCFLFCSPTPAVAERRAGFKLLAEGFSRCLFLFGIIRFAESHVLGWEQGLEYRRWVLRRAHVRSSALDKGFILRARLE